MAWNRSSEAPKVAPKKSPSKMRGIAAGLVVVAVALACAVIFIGKGEKSVEKTEKERGMIKEVTPAAAPKAEAPKEKKEKKLSYWEVDASKTNGFSEAQMRKWVFMHSPKPAVTNTAMASHRPKYAIFDTYVENEIACLMTLKPGQSLVGTPRYSRKINEEFIKSCETPIVIEKDDDEYTAQLKRDMNQMKIDLRQRMADGEDLGQILTETRNEIRRMAQVKREIEAQTLELIKEGADGADDIDTYVEAANKMLTDKGIAPMKINPITKRALARSLAEKNEAKQ